MSDNGLKVTVSSEKFSLIKSTDEKLDLIYQALTTQQITCDNKVEEFDGRIETIETSRKLEKAKIVGIGIGSGGGAAALLSWFKDIFSGG